ncbi:MAG TPA: 23S rRNA (guanosine(2251)-2'-O)-methyltransferase RlmB [Candidatus Kapabacteria bacterium]|nr:23S rRNA (guanosine(2251)-2'-O)-methyltransferase RlmB [Candidatus Kapabacteria bacterium]
MLWAATSAAGIGNYQMMDSNQTYVAGRRAALEILRDEASRARIEKVYLAHGIHGPQIGELLHLIRTHRVVHTELDRAKFRELERRAASDIDSQGVIVLIAQREYQELEDVLTPPPMQKEGASIAHDARGWYPLLVALDGIEDPHNIGAILRSAEAAGATAVLLPKRGAVLTPAVYKSSAGAANNVPIVKIGNLEQTIRKLQEEYGVSCCGLAGEAEKSIYEISLTGPICLIIGSEEKGLHRLVKERCEKLAAIPMLGKTASLNASVAAGVALFEAVRQRSAPSFSK